jgi:hypothetical protein
MNTPIPPFPEERLKEVARHFPYPPTPDVTRAVMKCLDSGSRPRARLRSAWVVAGLLVLVLTILFAVPSVRAEIIHFFQIGVVRIFPGTPTSTVESSLPQFPTTATPLAEIPSVASPAPSINEPLYRVTISDLAGETSLDRVQTELPFPIRLPEYPPNLGTPDRVFLQEDGGMVILVWTDPTNPQKALLSLYEIGPGSTVIHKYEPRVIRETQVNGQYAVWVQGPYMLQLTSGRYEFRRLVEGNTLIWEEDKITHRLESNQSLEDTIKIAESLK